MGLSSALFQMFARTITARCGKIRRVRYRSSLESFRYFDPLRDEPVVGGRLLSMSFAVPIRAGPPNRAAAPAP
jgi:hypothetical protein